MGVPTDNFFIHPLDSLYQNQRFLLETRFVQIALYLNFRNISIHLAFIAFSMIMEARCLYSSGKKICKTRFLFLTSSIFFCIQ
jgi:hypothetical protein